MPDTTPVILIADGKAVSAGDPLPVSATFSGSITNAIPTGVTITGGTQIAADDVVTQAAISFADLDLRMEPGDVLAVAIQTASSTATVAVSINQHEE